MGSLKVISRGAGCAISLVMLWLCCGISAASAAGEHNLLVNGDLTRGKENSPEGWHTAAWKSESDFSVFRWEHSPETGTALEITSLKPNDAYWAQTLHLPPGWYHFSANLRAEGVATSATGANLSILADGIISPQLRGTTGWTTVGFYLKVTQKVTDVVLGCRLGGFASLNTGKMFCRDIKTVAVSAPPAGADHVYDFDSIQGRMAPASLWEVIAAIVMLIVASTFLINRLAYNKGVGTDSMAALPPVAETQKTRYWSLPATGLALFIVIWLAIRRLDGTSYSINFGAALRGLGSILPVTGPAALRLWSFWALAAIVLGGILLQIDPELGFLDATLIGASGVWVIAYFAGQLLGPVGLFGPVTIWLMLAAGIIQLGRRLPKLPPFAISGGQKLTILAFLLLAVGLVPLQLGSPLAPYMDVLSYPASVQRILSFGVYLPFDNDPYGCWGPRAQTPGLELFYAMLAFGGRVKLGVLAHSGTMIPMAALLTFATYRLGLTLAGDTAGGIAALLLFHSNIFRRLTGMRGTAVAFVLVALGLACFLDRRRNRTLITAGAVILGASVASHAIDGALAMIAAALGSLLFLAEGDYRRFGTAMICLCGAILIALPEIAIGLGRPIMYPLMPVSQIAGLSIILIAVKSLEPSATPFKHRLWLLEPAAVVVFFMWIIASDALAHDSPFMPIMQELPLLTFLGMAGLAVWLIENDQFTQGISVVLVAAMLSFSMLGNALGMIAATTGSEAVGSGIADIGFKLAEYWTPYFLVFPAAIPFALMCDMKPHYRPAVILMLLTMLIYPWYPRFHSDYNYNEHSIAEEWGIDLGIAAGGFWSTTHDSRWTMDSNDFALVQLLRTEQAHGLITTATHILHIAHDAKVMGDFNHFSVFTGINDDPIVYEIPGSDVGWMATSRVRSVSELGVALAQHPAYILEQVNPPPWIKNPPDGYKQVFQRNTLHLFRRANR